MLIKTIIIATLLAILGCLAKALFDLLTASNKSEKMARSLTWRIGLSLFLFFLLIISTYVGWLHPHGLSA